VLALLPFYINPEVRSMKFRPLSQFFFFFFLVDCLLLGWIGGKPAAAPYIQVGQGLAIFYFTYLLIIMPSLDRLESFLWFQTVDKKI
jgi:quinol-cytochrome oxidoreductase complex cytochrome b subunit